MIVPGIGVLPNPDAVTGEPSSSGSGRLDRRKTGCLTCRKRRKKCDERKPRCEACDRLTLNCEWPTGQPGEASRKRQRTETSQLPDQHVGQGASAPGFFGIHDPLVGSAQMQSDRQRQYLAGNGRLYEAVDILETPADVHHEDSGESQRLDASLSLGGEDTAFEDIFNGIEFDELWASQCLNVPPLQVQETDGLQAGPNLTRDTIDETGTTDQASSTVERIIAQPNATVSGLPDGDTDYQPIAPLVHPPPSYSPLLNPSPHHQQLMHHYRTSLMSLVSCIGDTPAAPSALNAFTQLAEPSPTSSSSSSSAAAAAQALQMCILAYAGRHLVNRNQSKFETISDKLGDQGAKALMECLDAWSSQANGARNGVNETERITLLAGALMAIAFKTTRGDIWGYETLRDHIGRLTQSLYGSADVTLEPASLRFNFFENVVYHEVLSSFPFLGPSIVPSDTLSKTAACTNDSIHTLTGTSLPIFREMHRVADLVRRRRGLDALSSYDHDGSSIDPNLQQDGMMETQKIIEEAHAIEMSLEAERVRMQSAIIINPAFKPHRHLHEALRISCMLSIHSFLYMESPSSLLVRSLVKQSLALLEDMSEDDLPGWCSAHWAIFVTALCCCETRTSRPEPIVRANDDRIQQDELGSVKIPPSSERKNDRDRIDKVYEHMVELGFRAVNRSRRLVQEVWDRNQGGRVYVDWLDVLIELEWELFLM